MFPATPQQLRGRRPGADDFLRAGDEAVLEVARAHRATAAQVKLAWTLQHGPRVLAIPGTGNPDHLAASLAAGALRFSADEMTRLESVG